MSKPIKYSVAVILKRANNPDEYLAVKRPDTDADHRGHWGLPAVTMREDETPEKAAQRVCEEKLSCKGVVDRFVGIMHQRRNAYDMFLMDFELILTGGVGPDVSKSETESTKYVDQQWTSDPMLMMPAAKDGSCCSSIFLTDRGLLDRESWIESMEGSSLVG